MKGVWFNEKHSFTDFGLVLTSKEIEFPKPKTYIVDIPCADGSLDLSTALTDGEMKYENREINMEFALLHSPKRYESIRSLVASHLHGKIMKVKFDADPDFYYEGRCTIEDLKTDEVPAVMTITVDAEPYKLNVEESVITQTVKGSKTITVAEQKMKVVPIINLSTNMTMVYKTKEYQLVSGDNIIPDVQLYSGEDNILSFSGSGTVTIKFRGGEL